MSSPAPLRIGYVPEHYLLPLHLAKPNFPFPVELVPYPSGTGHMISSLRSDAIDLAIGLTEGWTAGLLTAEGQKARGYSIVGSWVQNPLRWAVVTGKNRNNIERISDLKTYGRVGISRMGSGSHIMAFVLAQQEGWFADATAPESKKSLVLVALGPFSDLRDGVTGKGGEAPLADFFMWEHFTTKPYFDGDNTPLKKIGEIYTPWPSWHIAASSSTFPNPEKDERLAQVFETLDMGIKHFNSTPEEAVRLLGTGELGCHYTEEDAREWLKGAEFAKSTRGVDPNVMEGVVKVLQGAGVVDSETTISKGDGVVGLVR
jgi:mannosyl-oligosaccharide alpha-1,3-glucosidase